MLFVHHADHLLPLDLQCCTSGNGSGRRQSKPTHASERLLSNEVASREKRDRGFFAVFRNDGDFCATFLKIENRVGGISLQKEGMLWLQFFGI